MADDILKDTRFTKYLNDPRYRQIPRHERKVKIDKRFQSMFNDEKFKVKYTVDKRGRPINETSTENLRRYYDLEDSEESSDEEEEEEDVSTSKNKKDLETSVSGQFVRKPPSDEEQSETEHTESKKRDNETDRDDNESEKEDIKLKNDQLVRGNLDRKIRDKLHDLEIDYARGEGLLRSDSSSEEESSEAEDSSEEDHGWGELDADADTTEDATKRLAVCNMDWDNIKASDILVLFNSFLPPGGVIHKVTIYPSEFGLKRLQEEEVRGPIELTDSAKKNDFDLSDDGGNEEGSSYNMEKLRRYQLNRLKYYYAVVECDSSTTADKLYTECDGMEYESSATKLDLRFIPDDTTFDHEPKEVCTKLPDLTKYKPRLFTTTALQQAKVDLTWDTTNPNRTEIIKNAIDGQIDDLEIKEYLASSSEDDEEEDARNAGDSVSEGEEDPIAKYKNLLLDIQQKEESKKNKDMEMEITWGLGVKEKAEHLIKKSQENTNLTPFEKLMEKRREKKKQKKLERQQKIEKQKGDQSDEVENESSDDIPSDVDMNDPYFAEEFNKPEFKNKVKKTKEPEELTDEEEEKKNAELELLLDDDDGKAHFSLKKIQAAENETKKSKRKKKLKEKMKEKEQAVPDFDINVDDKRFSAIYNSHHFNIDPTDPNYKKTKNMEKLIKEKLKRRPAETEGDVVPAKKTREEAELSLLVKSIKRKTSGVMKKRKAI